MCTLQPSPKRRFPFSYILFIWIHCLSFNLPHTHTERDRRVKSNMSLIFFVFSLFWYSMRICVAAQQSKNHNDKTAPTYASIIGLVLFEQGLLRHGSHLSLSPPTRTHVLARNRPCTPLRTVRQLFFCSSASFPSFDFFFPCLPLSDLICCPFLPSHHLHLWDYFSPCLLCVGGMCVCVCAFPPWPPR